MQFRTFTVTITPRITTYAGSQTFGEYTTEVFAKTRADAIKQARKERREVEGRYGVPATFRASIKAE